MRRIWLAFMVALGPLAPFACSTSAAPVALGGQCELTTDCASGLVCLPQAANGAVQCGTVQTGTRVCTNDTTGVQCLEDGAAPGEGGAAGGKGGAGGGGAAAGGGGAAGG